MFRLAPALAAPTVAFIVLGFATAPTAQPSAAPAAALANPDRPDADRQRDAARKPEAVVAFTGARAGDRIADVIPGTGYYSRIFSAVVGPQGHVYGVFPVELKSVVKTPLPPDGATPYPKFANVTAVVGPINAFAAPEALNIVFISDNYHDLHDPFFAPADLAVINKQVFKALKPGGTYIVVDHAAEAGSGLRDTNTRHRIDEATVRSEVQAAGFVFVGASEALRNPADTRLTAIFDPAIRGKTDQFMLKFRKPGR